MKKLILLLSTCFLISCASKENSEQKTYTFYSSPSFYGGFKIELDNETKTVIASLPYEYSLADSISPKTWKFIDSTDLASIKKFLPKESKFEIKPEESKFENLKKCFQELAQIKADTMPPCDGIGIYLESKSSKNTISKKVFYSPSELSKQGKLVINIYNITESIFKENSQLEYAIENSQRYFTRPVLKVKSNNPLYVKFLDDDSEKLEAEISKLPASKIIFVDLTNFHKNKDDYLEKAIRRKYSKIKWILRNDENYGFAE
jgi:hypothetical protein